MLFQSSFARNKYKFSVYKTAVRVIEESEIPDDEDIDNTIDM